MKYIPPTVEELENINIIRAHYQAANQHNLEQINPHRIKLIDVLDILIQSIQQDASESLVLKKDTNELLISAYIFSLETIANQYKLFDPHYRRGLIFNSGSLLYSILIAHLKITPSNPLTDLDKLYFLLKLYYFFHAHYKEITYCLSNHHLKIEEIEQDIFTAIQMVFKKLTGQADNLLKSIPSEKKIDIKMQQMLNNYLENNNYVNQERIFLAELAKGLVELLPQDEEHKYHPSYITRSMRIKIGFLLYAMESITNTYLIRSPLGNSIFYDLCAETLNIKPDEIDLQTKLDCLSAFENFLHDPLLAQRLESILHKPVENLLYQIKEALSILLAALNGKCTSSFSNTTISCAILGALVMSVPGYGLGFTLGCGVAQTNFAFEAKIFLNNLTEYVNKKIFNNAGHFLTHFASNMIIDTSLERACAKLFESLGMLLGAASGGLISIVIFDFSYQTVQSLCRLYKLLNPLLRAPLAKEANEKFVECLLHMPKEVFSEVKKNKLKAIMDDKHMEANSFISPRKFD